jgi:hypothetical protein
MYGVVNDKSAAAESIRKSGFLGASGDRLFRIQDDYIMLRATIGSRTVLRNIGHLDRDAVSDIEQRLKGMGYREAGREFKMKMVSTENVLKRLDAASSNYIETLERFSELIEIAKNAAPPTDTEINPRAPEPLRAAAQRCRDAIPELYCISVDKYSRVDTSQLHTGRLQVQLRVMRGSRLTYTGILTMNDHESPLCHPSIALEHDPRYSMLLDDKYRGVRIEDVENWQGLLADAAIRMNRLIRERIDHFEGRIRAAKRADAAATAVTAASLVKSS